MGWGIPKLERVVGSWVGFPGVADDWSSMVVGSLRVVGRVLSGGRWECGIGLLRISWLSIRVGALLVCGWLACWLAGWLAGWLVSLSAFALAGGWVQIGRARVWVGTVAWSHFYFLGSIWLFHTSEPVISVVSVGHFQIRALDMVYSSSLGSC